VDAARELGLELERLELFRWLRVPPYWLRVPARPAVPIWNHGLLVLRRQGAPYGAVAKTTTAVV